MNVKKTKKCPKCGGSVDKGLFGDRGYYSSWAGSLAWGKAVGFWKGLVNREDVSVYKCKKCGFLESYAVKKES